MAEPKIDAELERYREDYPILADSVYMNSNSMGAMHRGSAEALREYTQVWEREGVEAWDHWPAFIDETADMVARFFNGGRGNTTLGENVATLQARVASSLDYAKRPKVVIEQLMFPNVIYVWERFARLGVELELVPSDDGVTISTERMLEAIDERTSIVSISHAVYVSGALLDVPAICKRAHEVGALVMCDVYQTAGVVPIDVQAWDLDLLVGGSHKWLCGGPGTCFLWVRPGLREQLEPMTTGWMAHAAPFDMAPAPIELATDSWRMLAGTPSVPAYYVARNAYENLLEIGVDRIRAHNLALCRIIIKRALEAGLTVRSPIDDAARTGFVAVDFPSSEAASKVLVHERYKHDWRPNCGLRIGPHFYSTQAEVERMMTRVIELAR
ncbi:aminotransferase class V-fold PLP-dependent enzyme [Enhygromyxa salina]|uniref:Kynureninase n=1 Tax=Enhygromyxa salina TaxID=215803 RepID=A0A2S9Y2H0_9BACT|nr:aminotransferase class V-fold PLP-dependent enzyme [Enhygromyxa salina]PRP99317.1 Kynureninase [Enhygromyxa salina]